MPVNDATGIRLATYSEGANLSEDGTIAREDIRYCWIDEDGARVSPVHRDFGKAISFISDWPANMERLTRKRTEAQEELRSSGEDSYHRNHAQRNYQKASESIEKLTITGKPPARLRRLIIRSTVETIADHEAATVTALMGRLEL